MKPSQLAILIPLREANTLTSTGADIVPPHSATQCDEHGIKYVAVACVLLHLYLDKAD
jgi:hypothetical protein